MYPDLSGPVVRYVRDVEVAGSNPVIPTKIDAAGSADTLECPRSSCFRALQSAAALHLGTCLEATEPEGAPA